MTAAQTRILEMFQALSLDEREALLPRLAETIVGEDDELSPEEIAAIDEGLEQMRRGDVVDGQTVMARLAAQYGLARE